MHGAAPLRKMIQDTVRLNDSPIRHPVYVLLRACLKIAFCKILSQFASGFMLDLGGVVGYIDEIQHKIWWKMGRKIVGMNFQTRSRASLKFRQKGSGWECH